MQWLLGSHSQWFNKKHERSGHPSQAPRGSGLSPRDEAPAGEREELLALECAGDERLRAEVESLLANDGGAITPAWHGGIGVP